MGSFWKPEIRHERGFSPVIWPWKRVDDTHKGTFVRGDVLKSCPKVAPTERVHRGADESCEGGGREGRYLGYAYFVDLGQRLSRQRPRRQVAKTITQLALDPPQIRLRYKYLRHVANTWGRSRI